MIPSLGEQTPPTNSGVSIRGRLWGFALAAMILIADQITKIWVVDILMADGPRVIEVTSFFNLVMTWNPGVSFGMLGGGAIAPWMFLAFAALLSVFLGVWLWKSDSRLLHIGLGLMIGGALGNGIDRARWGAVADFLDVHAFGWHFWAFNIADASISIGAALLIIDSLFRRPA